MAVDVLDHPISSPDLEVVGARATTLFHHFHAYPFDGIEGPIDGHEILANSPASGEALGHDLGRILNLL